jgi:hypothetical protein
MGSSLERASGLRKPKLFFSFVSGSGEESFNNGNFFAFLLPQKE